MSRSSIFNILIFFFLSTNLLANNDTGKGKEVVIIQNTSIAKSEKEAILILPGFGDKKKRRKAQKAFFAQFGYDLFIPDFHHRKSIAKTSEKLQEFIQTYELRKYKKLHVFSYILGSWVLNDFVNTYGIGNIKTIVYDRSPLQERAPKVVVDKVNLLGRIVKGPLLKELSLTPYAPIENGTVNIGILVENKATKFIKLFKKKTLSYGPICWDAACLKQDYDQLIYVPIDHDQMYTRFDVVGKDIMNFIENGAFTHKAKATPFDFDPFGEVDLSPYIQ